MDHLDVAIVGAGPYGLSVAASLPRQRRRVFGTPMQTWRTMMAPDRLLRSGWDETSLTAPDGAGSIIAWADRFGVDRSGPIPLREFLAYAEWFCEEYVGELDRTDVASIEPAGDGFVVSTTGGDRVEARSVVLAVGVTPFAYVPSTLAGRLDGRVRFALDVRNFEPLAGKEILVLGGGQTALESAALATRAGADVELVTRGRLHWFADHEPYHPRSPLARTLYRLAYPAVGYGPPLLNRVVLNPDLFARLPLRVRHRLHRRVLRAGGSPWLKELVVGHVRVRERATVTGVVEAGERLRVTLADGTRQEVDELLIATGYRFDLDRLGFLDPALRSSIATGYGWPLLDRFFQSTHPGLFFVGYPAEGHFGPISRFVYGTRFAARRVAERLAR